MPAHLEDGRRLNFSRARLQSVTDSPARAADNVDKLEWACKSTTMPESRKRGRTELLPDPVGPMILFDRLGENDWDDSGKKGKLTR